MGGLLIRPCWLPQKLRVTKPTKKYVYDRFKFLSEVAPYFKKVYEKYGTTDAQMLQILTPHALDDAGAVCAAMMKAQMKDKSLKLTGHD